MSEIIAALVVGLAVGALVGIGWAWDRRFNEGRRYGYQQGYERANDQDALTRIRRMM